MSVSENNVELIRKTLPYAKEFYGVSVWVVVSTFFLLFMLIVVVVFVDYLWLKIPLSILTAFVVMRCFILFHDFQHKAILVRSKWASYLFSLFGLLMFTPASIWRQSHNFHHSHNTVIETSYIGSFWTVSVQQWVMMTGYQRYKYRLIRNPITIIFGFITIFIYDHCIHSFIRNPWKNISGLLSILLHAGLIIVSVYCGVFADYFFAWLVPIAIAGCIGSYLFYIQHNFPEVALLERQQWSHTAAALQATCFIHMSKLMHWFTGNIAYHHVHHLNHRIPFYRLPEAMEAIPELRNPKVTSLNWRDIHACLKLKLWDEVTGRMVSFDEANCNESSVRSC